MWFVIIGLIIAFIFSVKARQKIISFILGVIAILAIIFIGFQVILIILSNIGLVLIGAFILFTAVCIIGAINNSIEKKRDKIAIAEWEAKSPPVFTEEQIGQMLMPFSEKLFSVDQNIYKFNINDLPLGRVNAFLNFFDSNIYAEEPIYYSPKRSLDDIELREYGSLLTLGGLYIAKQYDSKNNEGKYKSNNFDISFRGMWQAVHTNKSITIKYQDFKKVTIKKYETTLPLETINEICQLVISSQLSLSMFKEQITNSDLLYENTLLQNEHDFLNAKTNLTFRDEILIGNMPNLEKSYNILGDRLNARQGGGYGAEYYNNTEDKAKFKNAEIVGNDNSINGPDRISNGELIQTKYYKDANKSINAAFDEKEFKYEGQKIEVPKDQYYDALKSMQKRIDNGEVPGAKPGDDPKKYVKRGHATYDQAQNVANAGTIDSLKIDILSGAISSLSAGGVSAVLSFANSIWNGESIEKAAENSLIAGIKSIGYGSLIYTISMQLSREKFKLQLLNNKIITNPIAKISKNMANKIKCSSVAKSSVGKKLGLAKLSGKAIISGGVIAVITFGPDICRALVGRISPQQLFKNASVGASGLAGAAIGQAIIPIPFVGAIIGGSVAGFIAKKVLDQFIEDDAVEMYQILKEEFLDVVMLSNLNNEEFSKVIELTFADKRLPHLLRDMYAYGNAREFAREQIVSAAVILVLKKREVITMEMIDTGYLSLFENVLAENNILNEATL
jgi:hypothetical protein